MEDENSVMFVTRLEVKEVANVFRSAMDGSLSKVDRFAGKLQFHRPPLSDDPFSVFDQPPIFEAMGTFFRRGTPTVPSWSIAIMIFDMPLSGRRGVGLVRQAGFGERRRADDKLQIVLDAFVEADPDFEMTDFPK